MREQICMYIYNEVKNSERKENRTFAKIQDVQKRERRKKTKIKYTLRTKKAKKKQ